MHVAWLIGFIRSFNLRLKVSLIIDSLYHKLLNPPEKLIFIKSFISVNT